MRISDWSSDVCASDLLPSPREQDRRCGVDDDADGRNHDDSATGYRLRRSEPANRFKGNGADRDEQQQSIEQRGKDRRSAQSISKAPGRHALGQFHARSEEHTSELQSLMRISYAVFWLKKKKTIKVKEDI